MNQKESSQSNVLLAVGGFVAMVAMLAVVYVFYVPNRGISPDQSRAAERKANLLEMQEAQEATLSSYFWIDKDKNQLNLPLTTAKALLVAQWEDPRQGRRLLIERLSEKVGMPAQEENTETSTSN